LIRRQNSDGVIGVLKVLDVGVPVDVDGRFQNREECIQRLWIVGAELAVVQPLKSARGLKVGQIPSELRERAEKSIA
jgi:hypothetical protein